MTIEIASDNEGFYGLPQKSVSTSNAGGKCVTDGETSPDPTQAVFERTAKDILEALKPTHLLNSTKTVAVATDVYWMPIDADTPRNAKLQLLTIGGVAQYGTLGSDPTFFTHWCPVPKKRK